MPKRYRPREVIAFLESLGFRHDRTRGDHYNMKDDAGRSVTVELRPKGGLIPSRNLSDMARQAGYQANQFRDMLERR